MFREIACAFVLPKRARRQRYLGGDFTYPYLAKLTELICDLRNSGGDNPLA